MKIELTITQFTAVQHAWSLLRSKESASIAAVEIEQPMLINDVPCDYVRVTFTAGWGGKASYDIDTDGNIAYVSFGESEISVEAQGV